MQIARTDREIPHFSFLFAFSLLILLRLAEGQLDRSCFAFGFGGRGKGERIKKSQDWNSTLLHKHFREGRSAKETGGTWGEDGVSSLISMSKISTIILHDDLNTIYNEIES
jgi:hypothetical protein